MGRPDGGTADRRTEADDAAQPRRAHVAALSAAARARYADLIERLKR